MTGAAGFVGSAVVRQLLRSKSATVAALVRPSTELWRLDGLENQYQPLFADLSDETQTRAAVLRFAPDSIVHAAMYNGHPQDAAARAACFQISVNSTHDLLETAHEMGVQSFIHMSSSLIYAASERPLTEENPIDPTTARGAAKAAALVLFRQLSRLWRMHSCELRIFSAYGPQQQPGRFIPALLRAAASGEEIALRPGPRHDYVHVDDIVSACLLALEAAKDLQPAEAFNIGGGVERTNEETVAAVEQATQRRIRIATDQYPGAHPSDTEHWCADISKAARLLGWTPKIDFIAGLRGMARP